MESTSVVQEVTISTQPRSFVLLTFLFLHTTVRGIPLSLWFSYHGYDILSRKSSRSHLVAPQARDSGSEPV